MLSRENEEKVNITSDDLLQLLNMEPVDEEEHAMKTENDCDIQDDGHSICSGN